MTFIQKSICIYQRTYSSKVIKTVALYFLKWIETLGCMGINLYRSIRVFLTGNLDSGKFFEQAARFGVDSLPISLLMVTITGMIIAIQVALEMAKQGAGDYVGMLVSLTIIRELGPVIGSFAVISLVGSSMSAEIATMKVTEQVDAIKVSKVDPISYLIAPRVFAGFFIMPFVIILASLFGVIGGLVMSKMVAELNAITYVTSVWQGLSIKDLMSMLVKAFVFGGLISLSSTTIGYEAKGGAIDVGNATTKAVVWSFVLILFADYFISWLFFSAEALT